MEDTAAISQWYCPSCGMDYKATGSGQDKDEVILWKRTAILPPRVFCKSDKGGMSAIKPDDREGYRVLKKVRTDIISNKIGIVSKLCFLSFKSN